MPPPGERVQRLVWARDGRLLEVRLFDDLAAAMGGVRSMIDWVSTMLEAWGRYERRQLSGGLGYSGRDSSCRDPASRVTSAGDRLPSDWRSYDFVQLVAAIDTLPDDYRRLRWLVIARYREGQNYRTMAGMLHRPQQTLRDHMHAAHQHIDKEMRRVQSPGSAPARAVGRRAPA